MATSILQVWQLILLIRLKSISLTENPDQTEREHSLLGRHLLSRKRVRTRHYGFPLVVRIGLISY
jgi:hypothetical protein